MRVHVDLWGLAANRPSREMQLFLIGYIIISICEIFTIGWFPLDGNVRIVSLQPMRLYQVDGLTTSRLSPPFTSLQSLPLPGSS